MSKVYKTFVADEVKAEGEGRTIRFRITTDAVDRERDILSPGGWKLDSYLANPVILWAHSYQQPPIARALEIVSTEHGLSSLAEFPPKGTYAFADTIYDLLKGGFLNAASVGFAPIKHAYNETRHGVDYSEQELLEFSVVPVPANPEALVEARAAGIDLEPMKQWAKAVLDLNLPDTFPEALVARVERLEQATQQTSPEIMAKQIEAMIRTASLRVSERGEHDDCPMGDDCPMKGKAGECDREDCPMRPKGLVLELEEIISEDAVLLIEDEIDTVELDPAELRGALAHVVAEEVRAMRRRRRHR